MDVLNLICDNENEKIQICIMCDLSEPEKDYLHEKVVFHIFMKYFAIKYIYICYVKSSYLLFIHDCM